MAGWPRPAGNLTPVPLPAAVCDRFGRPKRAPVLTLTDAHERAAAAAERAAAEHRARGDYAGAHRWAALGLAALRAAHADTHADTHGARR